MEERIAELEATGARKGNRKVSLAISGHVSQSVLFWDDGGESNTYVVGNKNDQTNFSFTGGASITNDWKAGYALTVRLRDTLSDEVDQANDDGGSGFVIWESNFFLESKTMGRFTLGQASRVSDTAPENDLSETGIAAYAGVQDLGGGFALRRGDGALAGVTWGDVYNHLNGDTANVVRYDTPEIGGFTVAASFGEDDIWDVGVRYAGQFGGLAIEAAVAYTENNDSNGLAGEPGNVDSSVVVGSIALLHEPTGLNALVAAGQQSFDQVVGDADGTDRTPSDASFIYTKLGLIANLSTLGGTAFYGEYGRFEDFLTAGADPAQVLSLDATAGTAARISGSEAEVWGVGIVQSIDAAAMQVYLGYRHDEADFDLVDGAAAAVATTDLENFDTFVAGGIISF